MDIPQLEAVRRQAAARVAARRPPQVTQSRHLHFEGEGSAIEFSASRPDGSGYLPPLSAPEWIDDALTLLGFGQWAGAHSLTLAAALEAGRTSREDAAEIIRKGVPALPPIWPRFRLYQALQTLASQDVARMPRDARDLITTMVRACESARGAVTEQPEEPETGERPDPPASQPIRYKTPLGNPAALPY